MEILGVAILITVVAVISIVGAYMLSERSIAHLRCAWARAVKAQDLAWQQMNEERNGWLIKVGVLVENNTKLAALVADNARRELAEVQKYMEALRQGIIVDVSKTVGAQMVKFITAAKTEEVKGK